LFNGVHRTPFRLSPNILRGEGFVDGQPAQYP
jgi:hypothetical protein